jgi:RNA polymerase sigma-54 factor
MAYEIKLDLKQSQQLVMTPQLRDAIAMLQMNNLELNDYLEKELEHNPFLEKDDVQPEDQTSEKNNTDAQDQPEDSFDAGSANAAIGAGGNSKFEDPKNSLENRLEDRKDLRTHLMDQLNIAITDARDKMIAALLIDRLDESGYLRETSDESSKSLGCSVDRVERLLAVLRDFDPTGIFARDLPDCLALQLAEKNRLDPAMQTLLDHLNLLADAEFSKLEKLCGVDGDDLRDMIAEIRSLNPKPAADFDYIISQTAIADVLMERLPKHVGGGWKVKLNHETLPRVLLNQDYVAMVENGVGGKKDKKFLTDKLHSANWLIQAMDQRAKTILKVATAIIEAQEGFFLFGVEFLKPLTLREIAEEVGVHESTVSRITIDKFIGTPRGLYPLKYFFGSGVGSGDGGADIAAEAIKAKIKTMIDNEDPKKILSDEVLTKALQADGIDIARRTVAKYREAMKILSSSGRRKQKKHLI